MLCPSNDTDLFALHYVFIPRINAHLEVFRQAYSRHRLRTEGHSSPLQLWIRGMLATNDHTAASGVYDNENFTDVSYMHIIYLPYACKFSKDIVFAYDQNLLLYFQGSFDINPTVPNCF